MGGGVWFCSLSVIVLLKISKASHLLVAFSFEWWKIGTVFRTLFVFAVPIPPCLRSGGGPPQAKSYQQRLSRCNFFPVFPLQIDRGTENPSPLIHTHFPRCVEGGRPLSLHSSTPKLLSLLRKHGRGRAPLGCLGERGKGEKRREGKQGLPSSSVP